MSAYLTELTLRLAAGLADAPAPVRSLHGDYLESAQRDDGGFAGRQGPSDLYYTSFALRSLALLGRLDGTVADRAADFLRSRLAVREPVIDLLSLVYAAAVLDLSAGIDVLADAEPNWRESVAETFERMRRDDGGYAKSPQGAAGSTYHTFLVLSCRTLLEAPVVGPDRIVQFILSQQANGGGFREIRAGKRAGVNPTAAAVGALRILDAVPDEVRDSTVACLAQMQTEEGGFRANTRIPIADLLSTFTALTTLADLGAQDLIDIPAAARYVTSLQLPEGGFRAAAWDGEGDVEYTFYGLGCLGLVGSRGSGLGTRG